jgi:aminopeptidase-like protein
MRPISAEQAVRKDQGRQGNASTSSPPEIGQEMYELIARLYPICRSITGDGVRETLRILQEHIPLEIREVPSGTQVFDWTVPKEWNITDAYIKTADGEKVVDFARSNLHVLNYSVPVKCRVSLNELKRHLYTSPEHPDWIPYRTSYYDEAWGFCLSHRQLAELKEGDYEVYIDSSLRDGYLTYGECFLKGKTEDEVLISTHVCHPSLANDNLSGIALATFLAKHLNRLSSRYSYRFLFTAGAIGSITWLSLNEDRVSRIKHGLVLSCVGDCGKATYKKTRRGNSEIDRVVAQVLKDSGDPYDIVDFSPYGHAERQFCSPGFNLAVGGFMRTPDGKFPEYHTSADNLQLVKREALVDSFDKCLSILHVLEHNHKYMNQNPKCEPQLGKRGLYNNVGGALGKGNELAMLWVLNLSDGKHKLLDIAETSNLPFAIIYDAAQMLLEHALLKEFPDRT